MAEVLLGSYFARKEDKAGDNKFLQIFEESKVFEAFEQKNTINDEPSLPPRELK